MRYLNKIIAAVGAIAFILMLGAVGKLDYCALYGEPENPLTWVVLWVSFAVFVLSFVILKVKERGRNGGRKNF